MVTKTNGAKLELIIQLNLIILFNGFKEMLFLTKLSRIDLAVDNELSLSPCIQTESISQGIFLPDKQFKD